jgi:hypothetical protein
MVDLENPMDANAVRAALAEVLQNIQTASGLECPAITGTTMALTVDEAVAIVVALAETQPSAPAKKVNAQ